MAGIDIIEINPKITLKSILHVFNLLHNLLSVRKVTNSLYLYSQDQILGKRIDNAKIFEGLYYIEKNFLASSVQIAVAIFLFQ